MNIFSQPVACLCTLSMVSLKTKFLNLGEAQFINSFFKLLAYFVSSLRNLDPYIKDIFSRNFIVAALMLGQ